MQEEKEQGKRGHETFQWEHEVYDITALLGDLERGAVGLHLESTFNRHEIEVYRAFLEHEPHPEVPDGMSQQHRIQVDANYAATLSEADLARPIILLHVGQGEGTLELADLEQGYNFVVADGNHRLIRAYQLGVEEVPIVVLLKEEARRYRCTPDCTGEEW